MTEGEDVWMSEVKMRREKTDGKSSGEREGTYTCWQAGAKAGSRVEAIRQAALPQIERRAALSKQP